VKYATNNLFNIVVKTGFDIEVKWTSHSTIGFDFGALYRTGILGLNLGFAVRNYSKTLKNTSGPYVSPSMVRYGMSMNLLSFTTLKPEDHSLMFALDYEDPLSFDEHYNLGLEYTLFSIYVLRIGYLTPHDENKINAGLGINDFMGFSLDYAWSNMGLYGNIHRFSVGYQ
ncbi:MAG: hypothetical protein GWN62_10035, partial [Aliifodinibius sp.]|nr:hypothetical protein [Fodinibius sp.]